MATKAFEILVKMLVSGGSDVAAATELVEELRSQINLLSQTQLNKLFDVDTKNLDINLTQVEALSVQMERLKEAAFGARLALQREGEALKEAAFGARAAETARLTNEVDRLKEAFYGAEQNVAKTARSMRQARELFQAGRLKFDLEVDDAKKDLDLVLQKGRQVIDLVTKSGKTRLDVDTSKLRAELDLVLVKGRSVVDMLVQMGKTRPDIDLGRVISEARAAHAEVNRLANQILGLNTKARAAAGGVQQFSNQVVTASKNTRGWRHELEATGREFLLIRRLAFGLGFSFVAREVLNVAKQFDGLNASLKAVFGEQQAAEELEFIRANAERLGLRITDLGKEYAKLTVATRSANFSQQETRDIFLSIAEAGARLSLSQEEVQGALVAVQQIASKGRVSLEELRQQLGDRLPGAIDIAAKSLGITSRRLFDMVEKGQLASDLFLKVFPAAIRASFGTDATTRIETTTAALQRFKNSVAEFSDQIVRAGALDGFLKFLEHLTALSKDPAVIGFFSTLSSAIGALFTVIRDHTTLIKDLIFVYAGFKAVAFVLPFFAALEAAYLRLTAQAGAAAVATTASAAGITAAGAAAAKTTPLILAVNRGFIALAAGVAAIDFIADVFEKGQEAAHRFNEANREIGSQGRIAAIIAEQRKQLEQWSGTVVLSTAEMRTLSAEGLKFYTEAAKGARDLAKNTVDSTAAQIKALKSQIELLVLSGARGEEAKKKMAEYKATLAALTKEHALATGQATIFNNVLKDAEVQGRQRNITLTATAEALKQLRPEMISIAVSGKAINAITFEGLDRETQALVSGFKDATAAGKSVGESIAKAFPTDLADGSVKSVTQVANAMTVLQNEIGVAGDLITEQLAKKLDKMTAEELFNFRVNAKRAFDDQQISITGLSILMDSTLRASIKNLGLDFEGTNAKISKTFLEVTKNVKILASDSTTAIEVMQAAIEKGISTAKTREELLLLEETLKQFGITSAGAVGGIKEAMTALDVKLLETEGKLDGPLQAAFDRLGIESARHIRNLARQATTDFNQIKASGEASANGIHDAFVKSFGSTEIGRAFAALGIQAKQTFDSVRDTARENFKIVANSGNASAEQLYLGFLKVRDAVFAAGGETRDLRDDLLLLREAMRKSFDDGITSVEEYGEVNRKVAKDVANHWSLTFKEIKQEAIETFETISQNMSSFQGFRRDFEGLDVRALASASRSDLEQLLANLQAQERLQTRFPGGADPVFLAGLRQAIAQVLGALAALIRRENAAEGKTEITVNLNGGLFQPGDVERYIIPKMDEYFRRRK